MSTSLPVADPTASMPSPAGMANIELSDSNPVSAMTTGGVPDPTAEANPLDDLLDDDDDDDEDLNDDEDLEVSDDDDVFPDPLAGGDDGAVTTTATGQPIMPTSNPNAGTTAASAANNNKRKKPPHPVTVQMATADTASMNGQAQGENTGRWTSEEHQLFLQGLEIHGKGWKKIAGLIKSRTVVQIRTHAQKYFQKLAKAKQNGEEGEVMMEGRGVPVSVAASMPATSSSGTGSQSNKRRKHSTMGTKRKAISSVVASAQRHAKSSAVGSAKPKSLPVAPVLSPYILPQRDASSVGSDGSNDHVSLTGPILEDSLFRFLTPVPVAIAEPQVNEVARQAGANPITLPQDSHAGFSLAGGEVSPTGVADWVDPSKDMPSWFSKGADVDALFDVAETLDWLADTGDLNENYDNVDIDNVAPAPVSVLNTANTMLAGSAPAPSAYPSATSMNTLPRIESGAQVVVPPLPSLFDDIPPGKSSADNHGLDIAEPSSKLVLHNLNSTSVSDLAGQVFDTHDEEEEFVSTILD